MIFARASSWESTDDAFLDAHIVGVASKVAGRVARVHFTDNAEVQEGALLLEIEPGDFEAQSAQRRAAVASAQAGVGAAEAALAEAQAHLGTLQAAVEQEQAGARAGQAQSAKAEASLVRTRQLSAQKIVPPQDLENAEATALTNAAIAELAARRVAGAESQLAEGRARLGSAQAKLETARAQVQQAEADLRLAELNGSYARLTAPQAGRATRKAVEPGAYVQVGQTLLSLVSAELWVTANFKESQIALMRPGQEVEVEVDAAGGQVFRGHVDSLQAGAGARFSLLPPENATGIFIKVVQRGR